MVKLKRRGRTSVFSSYLRQSTNFLYVKNTPRNIVRLNALLEINEIKIWQSNRKMSNNYSYVYWYI